VKDSKKTNESKSPSLISALSFKKGYFARENIIYAILFLVLLAIASRLFILQVVEASDLKAKGIERRTRDQSLLPERGKILDAQGNVLAQSIPVKEIYADPRGINDQISKNQTSWTKAEIASKLGEILKIDSKEILDKLDKDLAWISIAHQVELEKVEKIQALKIPGIGFNNEQKRVYPMDSLAASALGIVNLEGHGVEGLESYYDQELYGTPGYSSQQQGTSLASVPENNEPPKQGANLQLTLDSTIQYLVEQQLDILVKTTQAKRVTILAMDPLSGKILGMGSRPTFNPNDYAKSNPEDRRNLSISMSYEPGSTFKIITGSAALEEGAITPDEKFDDPGYYKVGPRIITNWDSDVTVHGWITFTRGMELSDNVVLSQVGMKLGLTPFYTYLKAFGFGTKTGIDISGEESGLLVPQDKARTIDLASMSFGQANLVTPIQLLTAISAVANGGTLNKPYIVDKITYPDGTVKENKPTPVRQVISKTTATQMTTILENVVNNGTGGLARIPGIRVAGKTGTAQKVDPKTGGYSTTDFIASFAAFAPADNPKIAVLVTIDTPRGDSHQGGTLGGPRAKAIIEGALQYYGIPVAHDTESVVTELPETSFKRPAPSTVKPSRAPLGGETVVPDLTGLTMRQTGEALSKAELKFNFSGSGLANSQNPQPGQIVNKGTLVEVKFAPLIAPTENSTSPPPTP
jgi:cell division protein FtsI (penicillin-binding protein 3)/stage V sporulation protein D (sporulation-specific penicillin-binding protein)